jgi:Mrp family chromosome partitioning ATPase
LPFNPSELLGSDALARVLDRLGHHWDMVVLDSAPVGPAADTLLLAHEASASLLVARSGRTRRTTLHGALTALFGTGRPVLGVVLNDEHPSPLARFSRYDYYHHGYWSDVSLAESDTRTLALRNGSSN